jgi:hypothetical protein
MDCAAGFFLVRAWLKPCAYIRRDRFRGVVRVAGDGLPGTRGLSRIRERVE